LAKSTSTTAVLRVELLNIDPLIWRRVRVARTTSFKQLHEILQIVLGWQDSHLHEFRAGELALGNKDADEADERETLQDESEWSLADLLDTGVSEFEYVYDFGDDWVHRRAHRAHRALSSPAVDRPRVRTRTRASIG
jgi:hypothetical protein